MRRLLRNLFPAIVLMVLSGDYLMAKPLKVYILAGQSNMEGHANESTLAYLGDDAKTAWMLKDVLGPDGQPVVCEDVYIYLGTKKGGFGPDGSDPVVKKGKLTVGFGGQAGEGRLGPEFGFGIYMQKQLQEPILLIKTAWGGKDLCHDFRPPSAGKWVPGDDHPDVLMKKGESLPIPKSLDLKPGYVPGREYFDPFASHLGNFLGLGGLRGCEMGKHNGVYPLYVAQKPHGSLKDDPLMPGDVIIGVNGQGLRKNPVNHWRQTMDEAMSSTWSVRVTRWRSGVISQFDLDLSQTLPNGGADVETANRERAEERARNDIEKSKSEGLYYRKMVQHVKDALADIKDVYPEYDATQGYKIEGFVWFQGWNDKVNAAVYPNSHLPKGYEQYSWLLSHFIRDVRKDFHAPDMKFVIGVLGVGGVTDKPDYFRQGMAAPAGYPEFKGSVAAVETAPFWPSELDEIEALMSKADGAFIALKRDNTSYGELTKEEEAAYLKMDGGAQSAFREQHKIRVVGAENMEIWKRAVSHKGFHYYGCGKFFVQIGKAFADAMLAMEQK